MTIEEVNDKDENDNIQTNNGWLVRCWIQVLLNGHHFSDFNSARMTSAKWHKMTHCDNSGIASSSHHSCKASHQCWQLWCPRGMIWSMTVLTPCFLPCPRNDKQSMHWGGHGCTRCLSSATVGQLSVWSHTAIATWLAWPNLWRSKARMVWEGKTLTANFVHLTLKGWGQSDTKRMLLHGGAEASGLRAYVWWSLCLSWKTLAFAFSVCWLASNGCGNSHAHFAPVHISLVASLRLHPTPTFMLLDEKCLVFFIPRFGSTIQDPSLLVWAITHLVSIQNLHLKALGCPSIGSLALSSCLDNESVIVTRH